MTRDERLTADRLAERARRCAQLCEELDALDRVDSPFSVEADALCDVLDLLRLLVDTQRLRFSTAVPLMDLVFDLQEATIAERKRQIGKPGETSCGRGGERR